MSYPPPPPPYWFSLNNSEIVKAKTLVFCSIQWHFIRDIGAKFGIPNLSQSPGIGQNSDRGIPDFQVSGLSLMKENCHNFRTCDDIDKKLEPVTKLDKTNKTKSKKLMMKSCLKVVTSLSFSNLWPIWSNPEARCFFNSNLLSYKNWKQN